MIRFFRHLFTSKGTIRNYLSVKALTSIEKLIQESELQHRAEICFTVEANLPLIKILKGVTPRQRAIEVFSNLRIWDTEENSGVLLYLLLADKDIEIIADRGISKLVQKIQWTEICEKIKKSFQAKQFEQGVLDGLIEISHLLKKNFPSSGDSLNEISNKPVLL